MTTKSESDATTQTPCGLNHVVLNVRDLEAAHRFWAEYLGFKQVGTLRRHGPGGRPPVRMRFYSGEHDGKLTHHDIALVERELADDLAGRPQALNHVAIAYPSREAWEKQITFLIGLGLSLYRRVERGVTHSIHLADPDGNEIELVYELPRELWEGNIDAALNQAVEHPINE